MTKDDEDMLDELWEQLLGRVDYDADDEYHDFSHEERVFMLTFWFSAEMDNGGPSQFIYNTGGNRYAETIAAMEEIGANRTAEYLKRVETIFREETGKGFSTDLAERREQLEQYGERFYDMCDDEWEKHSNAPGYISEETRKCLVPFVNRHRESD